MAQHRLSSWPLEGEAVCICRSGVTTAAAAAAGVGGRQPHHLPIRLTWWTVSPASYRGLGSGEVEGSQIGTKPFPAGREPRTPDVLPVFPSSCTCPSPFIHSFTHPVILPATKRCQLLAAGQALATGWGSLSSLTSQSSQSRGTKSSRSPQHRKCEDPREHLRNVDLIGGGFL